MNFPFEVMCFGTFLVILIVHLSFCMNALWQCPSCGDIPVFRPPLALRAVVDYTLLVSLWYRSDCLPADLAEATCRRAN